MPRSLLSEKICPDLCVYIVFMNMNFLNMIFLNMNMLFFLMFSFNELPLCASRHFSKIFLINAHLEEDVFIKRELLQKVHRLLTFLEIELGVYFNLRFQMQETDELNVILSLSPSYEGSCKHKSMLEPVGACYVQWACFLSDMLYRLLEKEREERKT